MIYKRLDPKSRAKLKASISKRQFVHGSTYKEKNIAVADNYIKRHKAALRSKKKHLPLGMQNFLINEANKINRDSYVRSMLKDVGIEMDSDNEKPEPMLSPIENLIYHIKMNQISDKVMRECEVDTKPIEPDQLKNYGETVASTASVETFNALMSDNYTHRLLMDWFSTWHGPESFVFTMINHHNHALLQHIFRGDYPAKQSLDIQKMIDFMSRENIAVIFFDNVIALKVIVDYFGYCITDKTLHAIRERAEEHLSTDSALFISKCILDRQNRSLEAQ